MREYIVESELGRFSQMLSIHSMGCFQTNRRIKTAGYRRAICRLVVNNFYRIASDTFNENYHRKGTEYELSYGTLAGDIEQEGKNLIEVKKQTTRSILKRYGFDQETGLCAGEAFPEAFKNAPCEMITIDPDEFMKDATPGWIKDEVMDPVVLVSEELDASGTEEKQPSYSQPDTEEFHTNPKRRGERIEVAADIKKKLCNGFAKWYNTVTQHEYYGIIHPWTIERDSLDVVYISIDAVYVDKQTATRIKASDNQEADPLQGKVDIREEEKEKRIGHMNIKMEWGTSFYYITSTDTNESFKEMIAVIMENELYTKYMIFMTDGELAINDKIKLYCHMWNYRVELDWIHLEHKCYDRLSNALKGKRVPDPRGDKEYYKRGPKKGQLKSQTCTSLSRLYARAICRILWVGNVDEAIYFLEHIDPSVISKPAEIEQLITYLRNKKDWIPCYALRKKAGLKNSSNGVEGQNSMNVAERQKHNGTSWRPDGSGNLASLKTMFDNKEDEVWFNHGRIPFRLVERST